LLPEVATPSAIALSNRRVMQAHTPDPEALTPSAARTGKQVKGWRAFDPLRRIAAGGDRSPWSTSPPPTPCGSAMIWQLSA
jgi:hypothetical protein